ncbi:hypothetical protein DPV78_002641 [Talaromyces pinophilus]|nr:hypothetical protein DPV78_002641 [Talaromyces pinophilus]
MTLSAEATLTISLDPSSAVRANRDGNTARASFAEPEDSPPMFAEAGLSAEAWVEAVDDD